MSLKYRIIPVTPFQQNCTLIWCEDTRRAAVVDPGGDLERIRAAVEAEGVTLEKILVTHGHIDHAGGVGTLARTEGLPPPEAIPPGFALAADEPVFDARKHLQVEPPATVKTLDFVDIPFPYSRCRRKSIPMRFLTHLALELV